MQKLTLAYFSMECGIDPRLPTYAGGLGILAGDTLHAAADLGVSAASITLLHRKGYFRQHLNEHGVQSESEADWTPEKFLELMPPRVQVNIAGRMVQVQAWRYNVRGEFGHSVPLYFLDTDIPENEAWDRNLTNQLYGQGNRYRLCQEIVLGFGGVAMLRALGYHAIEAYHMNEGHSALVTMALLEEQRWGRDYQNITSADIAAVSRHCVFTTHTPLLVGHDEFPLELTSEILGSEITDFLRQNDCCPNGCLNMTNLALNFSGYVNGVSMSHEQTSRRLFPNHRVDAVTNGVHAITWTAKSFQQLYDKHIPQWRRDNLYLRYARRIPPEEIWQAHTEAKQALLAEVARRTGVRFDPSVMTLGFARRATAYKRADMIFQDAERLRQIIRECGPLQIIYGGKAHPRDEDGKAVIRKIFQAAANLSDVLPVVYLEEYDMALGKYLCSGVDLWLNTPQRPKEASGTSGMKAALNGVPTFSTMDGWWLEGHIEGVTGWSIGESREQPSSPEDEVASLYSKLEEVILPMFYQRPRDYREIMRSAIAQNGSYFNAQRMFLQYMHNAYRRNNGNGPATVNGIH